MPDRLSSLLQRFALRASVVRAGPLRGAVDFDAGDRAGCLHLVRRGPLTVTVRNGRRMVLREPSALFYPRASLHRLEADPRDGTEVVCAAIEFGVGDENPLLRSLPARMVLPLAEAPALEATQALLFEEACARRCGHAAVVRRLTEVLVVQLLRIAVERRLVDAGLLAGLADPRLAKALTAMHAAPGRAWTIEALAHAANMSRSRFAALFTRVMGIPAGEYLMQWRVGVAKGLLRRGRPVKQVALEVGYGASSTFGRAFAQVTGAPPTAWLRRELHP